MANGGQLAVKDDWVYMNPVRSSGGSHSLVKAKPDGSGLTKLSDDNAISINAADDWLYYIALEQSEPNAIYKIRTNGTDRTLLSQISASQLRLRDGWIYYLPLVEMQNEAGSISQLSDGIYRIKTDGTNEQKLLDNPAVIDLYMHGDRIYYRTEEEGRYKLHAMNLDGSGQQTLQEEVNFFIIADDWIYCVKDRKQLRKMSLDGTVDILLFETDKPQLSKLTYNDGWVYFTNGTSGIAGSVPIEQMRIDGTDRQTVATARPTALYIAGDEMYFANWIMGETKLEHFKLNK